MDLNVGKYTTTQEMFLSKVGISNMYTEDNTLLEEPFFVMRINNLMSIADVGNLRGLVRIYQEKSTILRIHNQAKGYDTRFRFGIAL